jgi:glycerophosphoryl diester phosphodiesterase
MNRLFEFSGPMVLAHRGASAHAPENTLAAFRLASEHGADGIELDAKLSRDGEVVVFHDLTLERTTGMQGRVKKLTFAELRKLEAGSHKAEKYRGELIPTLDEVFETVGKQLYVNVELTNYDDMGDALVEKVVEKVKRHQLQDWVMFSSFWPINLMKARRMLPEVPVAILANEGRSGWLARSIVGRWVSPEVVNPTGTPTPQAGERVDGE